MKSIPSSMVLAVALACSAAYAQMVPMAKASSTKAATPAEYTEAEVRKVDKAAKTILLKHGEIKNLNMGAMTMMFDVKDAAQLARVKAGDKVRFKAITESGRVVVTDLQPAK